MRVTKTRIGPGATETDLPSASGLPISRRPATDPNPTPEPESLVTSPGANERDQPISRSAPRAPRCSGRAEIHGSAATEKTTKSIAF